MVISIDSETDLIDRGRLAPPLVCVSWHRPGEAPDFSPDLDECRARVTAALESDDTIVGANFAYDMAVFAEQWPDLIELVFDKYRRHQVRDIQLDQKAIDIASRGFTYGSLGTYSLGDLCRRYKIESPDKEGPWRTEFSRLRGVLKADWPDGARQYVLEDADRPTYIHLKQEQYAEEWLKASGHPLLHLAGKEAYKAFVLHLISCWGVQTSARRVERLRAAMQEIMDEARVKCGTLGLIRPDGSRDTKAAKARMKALVPNPPLTETGQISLNKEACDDSGDEYLQLYSMYSQQTTLMSRVEDMAQGVLGGPPLQTNFDTLLETSRTSTSKPRPPLVGVQAQNFPRKAGARECLEPRPGCVFIRVDIPTAELRSLSQVNLRLFGKSVMAEQLNAGKDLHSWFAGKIMGKGYEEFLALPKGTRKPARDNAKPCNFGFPGGLGAATFVVFAWVTYKVRLTLAEAEELKTVWLRAFPEMRRYFDWINGLMRDNTAMVKHVMTGRWRGFCTYCQACNTQFQELTATGASTGLEEVSYRCYSVKSSALYGCRPVLYTHDEIVAEAPVEQAHEAALELSKWMAEGFNQWHPDVPVLPCTGPTDDLRVMVPEVGRIYSKDMETVWGPDGKLVPWLPEGFDL